MSEASTISTEDDKNMGRGGGEHVCVCVCVMYLDTKAEKMSI